MAWQSAAGSRVCIKSVFYFKFFQLGSQFVFTSNPNTHKKHQVGFALVSGAFGVDLEKSILVDFWTQGSSLANLEIPVFGLLV